jgi:TatD DNase family protein
MIDTHAHLDDAAFSGDLPGVMERARSAGVDHIVTVGTDMASSRTAAKLSEGHESIWAAVGVHPHDASKLYPADLDELRELARGDRVVAIGETGLDFYRNLSPREAQISAFRLQLDLARELSLPVIIHDRDAHEDTLRELKRWVAYQYGQRFGVLHCYSGDLAMAQEAVALGFYISIAGPVTYANNGPLVEVVRQLPLDRLLLETDCPYLAPEPYRGRRNEPAFVVRTAREVARIRGLSVQDVVTATTANAVQLFGGPL